MDIYTLPNVKWMASGKLLHSTWRSARCFVMTYRGGIGRVGGGSGGRANGDICMYIVDSLCYTAETNTTF